MRLPKLENAVGKANARYFYTQGFISLDIYNRVVRWFDGQEDEEAQRIVTRWMKSDAAWLDEVAPTIVKHFWYVAPVVRRMLGRIREMLLSRIREFES